MASLGGAAVGGTVWRIQLGATAGGADTQNAGARLGFKSGMVVQELGWDEDVDDSLRIQIEDAIDADMVDGDYGNVVEDPVLYFCEDWMLADEVTHVKMGSDWLRRLTEKDPERRERALEFQRTVDSIFNLGGFRGEEDDNPIQLARNFRRLAGFSEDENDSLAELARQSTEEARQMAEMATAALDASAQGA